MIRINHPCIPHALTVALSIFLSASACLAQTRVLLVAGPPSHGWGEHEHPDGCTLLAACLNACGLGIEAEVSLGWPTDTAQLKRADAIVIYGDGQDAHVANGHVPELREHVAAGKGLAVLHYALEASPGELADFLLEYLGGRFEVDWSVNPKWALEDAVLATHEVTRGVQTFALHEEFYYHLRFRDDICPILQALPPTDSLGSHDGPRSGNPTIRQELAEGKLQTLAWAVETAGARAFGFTGGHYHRSWGNPDFRTLILNAVAWAAGVEIPAEGVASSVEPIPHHETIEKAIALGDRADVERQIAVHPDRLQAGSHPTLTPLHQAILRKKSEIACWLVEAGADVNRPDSSARTPLHLAVERGDAAVAKALMAHHAQPNQLDKVGWSPLHHAAAGDKVDVARALLEGGADSMARSERGGTPLHEAAASGGQEMIQLLLKHGTDPDAKAASGVTALDIARESENAVAIRILSENR